MIFNLERSEYDNMAEGAAHRTSWNVFLSRKDLFYFEFLELYMLKGAVHSIPWKRTSEDHSTWEVQFGVLIIWEEYWAGKCGRGMEHKSHTLKFRMLYFVMQKSYPIFMYVYTEIYGRHRCHTGFFPICICETFQWTSPHEESLKYCFLFYIWAPGTGHWRVTQVGLASDPAWVEQPEIQLCWSSHFWVG